jgi:peptidoglycan/LPS O-acetylase OafA/YrhL
MNSLELHKLSNHETDILKGLAILSVIINHFINNNVDPTLDSLYLVGYANGIIIIFFILSGYGIYYSLNKSGSKNWKQFYLKRFGRIYPIFLVGLIILIIFNRGWWPPLSSFFFMHSPFWFIDAIVYCYLLTPLFSFILDKLSFNRFILFFSVTTLVLAFGTYLMSGYNLSRPFIVYRYLAFSIFLAYIGGMALMKYQKEIYNISYLNFIGIYLVIFVIFLYLTRTPMNPALKAMNGTIFLLTSLLLIASIIKTGYLKTKKLTVIAFFGTCSYSIYLFQSTFFSTVYKATNNNVLYSLIVIVILFPIFLGFCYFTEQTLKKITNHLINLVH